MSSATGAGVMTLPGWQRWSWSWQILGIFLRALLCTWVTDLTWVIELELINIFIH